MTANPSKFRLLICAPEDEFLHKLRLDLERIYEVQQANHVDMALFLAREWEPQLCIIKADSALAQSIAPLRKICPYNKMGIFVVSEEKDRSLEEFAFRSGADHFLTQPFEISSLHSRLQALMKRIECSPGSNLSASISEQPAPSEKNVAALQFGGIMVYPRDFLIKRNGKVITTTPTQFRLLLTFISHKEQLLTRSWIREAVWANAQISPRSIDAQISKLKRLVPELDQTLVNVYGKGYILMEPKENAA